ncbi:MAG: hypothetical protein ACK413_02035 [Patescibacteria group bacterium]
MRLNLYQFFRNFLPRFIFILTIIIIISTIYFLYKNVWEIFTRSKEAILLKGEISVVRLRTELFKKIKENFEKKKKEEEINFENLRNPFVPLEKIEIE